MLVKDRIAALLFHDERHVASTRQDQAAQGTFEQVGRRSKLQTDIQAQRLRVGGMDKLGR